MAETADILKAIEKLADKFDELRESMSTLAVDVGVLKSSEGQRAIESAASEARRVKAVDDLAELLKEHAMNDIAYHDATDSKFDALKELVAKLDKAQSNTALKVGLISSAIAGAGGIGALLHSWFGKVP